MFLDNSLTIKIKEIIKDKLEGIVYQPYLNLSLKNIN